MVKRYGIEGELIYQKDDGHIVRYEDYEILQHKLGGVSHLCEEAMRINCEWEKAMMASIGEDGIGSVTKAIEKLKADKQKLQQKLDAMEDKLARSEDYSIGVDSERMEYIKKCNALAAENAALKISRALLAENTLETCNSIASAGFRHEAIMRGLMASTGNGNKYPKPITTLVDEALREIETPATDAYLNSVRAEGLKMAIDHMNNQTSEDCADVTVLPVIEMYKKLISGTHDTAYKAG